MGFPQDMQLDPDFERMLKDINDEIVAEEQERKRQAPADDETQDDGGGGEGEDQ